jgi:hypothetical protein
MARLGAADLAATTNTDVYTVPANRRATFTVSMCNRTTGDRQVRLALRSGALTAADYVEYDVTVPANGVLERSGLILTSGQIVTTYASATGMSVVVYGVEEQV